MSDPLRELDHRTSDRLDVWLLGRKRDDRVVVAVVNESTGERFRIDVRHGERALDVFHHPHASSRGRAMREGLRVAVEAHGEPVLSA